ncbi:MAG: NAD(P)-dependent alcohol dehydrogenase [Planctomycetota bacterium]
MKAYELQATGSLDGLRLVDRPQPQPGHGQIVVRVRAASLNYRDLIVMLGAYGKVSLPLVPLSDGAGEVVAVGEGVTRWQPGDRVAGTFFPDWLAGPVSAESTKAALGGGSSGGMLAEFVALAEHGAVRVPEHLTFEEAATLPCAALTAWNALVEQGRVKAGETVLLLGTGGVSIFGLQIAKLHGARTIITSSSDEKLARATSLGADATINYRTTPDWEKRVLELTGGLGADHVLEVGGAGTFAKSLRTTRVGGHVALIGVLAGVASELRVTDILMKSLRVNGIYVGSRAMFESLNRAAAQHHLKPVIDRVFPFADARAAYEHLQSGKHFGKVVIANP